MDSEIVHLAIEKAMSALFPHGAGQASHLRVRNALDTVAQTAYREGETNALMNLLTIEEAAERCGVSTRRMRAIAKNRYERFGIGWQVPGTRQWLFCPGEIDLLRPDEKYRRKEVNE